LGLISNTGEETGATIRKALTEAGLFSFFAGEPELLIYSSEVHMEKDSPEIFRLACRRAGLDARPERCLFVGDDERERQFASEAGMQVAGGPQALAEGAFLPTRQPSIPLPRGCRRRTRIAWRRATGIRDTSPGP